MNPCAQSVTLEDPKPNPSGSFAISISISILILTPHFATEVLIGGGMSSAMSPSVVMLGFLLTLMAPGLHGKVVMVYSVTRHGARNVLPKTALLQETDSMGGPTLLPEGQSQAYRAGVAYRARYIDPASCSANNTCLAGVSANNSLYGVVNTNGVAFSNYNLNARSSALDRTIMTALSFLTGVLPPLNNATATRFLPDGQQVVPVYSQADSEDILIRAYSKCQAYQDRLTQWFGTEEFQNKSQESQALRNSISALVPNMNTSLANWWNVYDAFNVWRTYDVGNPTPDVDNATFSDMQSLAYWLETTKMQSNLTGNLLGGTILADLLQHVEDAVDAVSANVQIYYKVVHLSGHYNTQLGTLAALELDTYPGASSLVWLKKIPSLAALMAFEVIASEEQPGQYAVRLVIQDGPAANYTTVALPCSQSGDAAEAIAGAGSCTLDAFRAYVSQRALNGSQWCTACQDSSTAACQLRTAKAQLASLNATADASSSGTSTNSTSCSEGSSTEGWKIAVSVVVTFLGTALLTALGMRWLQRRQRGGWSDPVMMAQLSESGAHK